MLVLSLLTAFLAVGAPAVSPQSTETATPRATPPSAPPSDTEVSDEIVVVETRGAGATPREAFDDAVREALRQVVGTFIRSDSRLQNDQLVEDRVISHSQGFIEKVEKIGIAELKDGVYLQEARVHVRRGRISAALVAPGPQSVEVDGSTLAARVTSMIEQKKSADELLGALFEGWPASVMKLEVAQKPTQVADVPDGVNVPADHVYYEVKLDAMIDDTRWRQWCASARQVFSAVSLVDGTVRAWNPTHDCKPVNTAPREWGSAGGNNFVATYRVSMSDLTAKARHYYVRPCMEQLHDLLGALMKTTVRDPGSLKDGMVQERKGTPVALYSKLGAAEAELFLLPLEDSGRWNELSSLGLHRGNYPGFASLPKIDCDLVSREGTTVGTRVRSPAAGNVAVLGTYAGQGLGGTACDFSTIVAPVWTFTTAPGSQPPLAHALLPGFASLQNSGTWEEILSTRMTLVFGFAVARDEVENISEVRASLWRPRAQATPPRPTAAMTPMADTVDGATLAARVTSMIEQKRSAQELIEALFEGWPASVMNSEVSQGPLESIRGVKRRPEPASSVVLPPSHTYVEVKVDVWVNQDKWMEWIKAARQVFRAVALKEREFKWNLKSSPLVSATKTGEGLCFVGGFRDYMSSQMARASHLNVRSNDAELERELKSLLTEVTPDDGSLKGGVSSQLSGTPVALYGKLGSNTVTLYVLPIEEHGQDAMLREAGLQTAIYPSFAPVPRISCELVTKDELTVGSVAREPAKDHLAIVGNYTSPGYSGQFGENFSMIGSPLVGFDTPHKLNPRAYAFVPGFHAIQRNGSSERVFAPRMTFVFGYVVPDDELEQIKTVRIEVTSERGDSR